MTIPFFSVLEKLPFHCLIETNQSWKHCLETCYENSGLNLMALLMLYVESCVRENIPIYYTKNTGINMHNLAIVGVLVINTVIVI